jgi:Predicted SAM-dependent RNA methyltransferase
MVGDDPPRDRTAELRALGFPTRHLGPVQMTTDTALGVTKRVVVDRGSSCPLGLFPSLTDPTDQFRSGKSHTWYVRTYPVLVGLSYGAGNWTLSTN